MFVFCAVEAIGMAKVILHADLNNFYASVACLHRPDLREVPVAVCGDPARRHGIVLAKNMPAKRYGIQTGQVLWQAFQLCPRLTTIAPDYREVSRMSQTVRTIFGRYTDRVQPFGIDEAWLDLTAPDMTLEQGERIANHLRHTVREETGLTVSVGVSDSRVLAKLGSDLKKPDAVSLICEQNRSQVLDPLPIGSLLFVGRATARKLNAIGIYTVGQLAAADPQVLRGVLGKAGLTLSGFARGADDASLFLDDQPVKSVGNSTTTPSDVTDERGARLTLLDLSESVAFRLRQQGMAGRVVELSLRDTAMRTVTRQLTLDRPTDCSSSRTVMSFSSVSRISAANASCSRLRVRRTRRSCSLCSILLPLQTEKIFEIKFNISCAFCPFLHRQAGYCRLRCISNLLYIIIDT